MPTVCTGSHRLGHPWKRWGSRVLPGELALFIKGLDVGTHMEAPALLRDVNIHAQRTWFLTEK